MDAQLYPIFNTQLDNVKELYDMIEQKKLNVLKDIEQAHQQIQERIQTTLTLQTRDQHSLLKIEQVIGNLRTLKSKLEGIRYDYETLIDGVLQYLNGLNILRKNIEEYFTKYSIGNDNSVDDRLYLTKIASKPDAIERRIIEHDQFRQNCLDKFRTLITQSEFLIERVRALEPSSSKSIDTDRILKLLENLRFYFENGNDQQLLLLNRLEKITHFQHDLDDVSRNLISVTEQLSELNSQTVDSLAAAKTTSLAFEYFERNVEVS